VFVLKAFSLALVFACFALSFTDDQSERKQISQSPPADQMSQGAGLDSLRFLVGKWSGEGSGDAGQGSGYFTFEEGLQGKVLVRKNHAEYPATKDRPAFTHEDLMVVYADPQTGRARAFYTDSEGHVINYDVSASGDGRSVIFLSDPRDAGPRYRLTYTLTQPDRITLTFEMATPERPDQFRKIIEGKMRKVASAN
jgi:hypothetical protein